MKNAISSILLASLSLSVIAADNVSWVCTTDAEPWKTMPALKFENAQALNPDLTIKPKELLQTIDGFGGCFNELGWKVLLALPDADREKVVASLFDKEGCDFTLARMPIGASDYGNSWYSLDDVEGDLKLEKFNIDRDKGYMLKYVAAAMKFKPQLGVWISPWSPPAWMKDNNNYSKGKLKQDPENLKSYANYLAKAVDAYQKEGLNIYALMIQNEPVSSSNYPTCLWSGEQLRDFIRDYAGPAFRDQKVKAELWYSTVNNANPDRFINIAMADPEAAKFIVGVAYQWEGQNAIAKTHEKYPQLKLMQSESECGANKNNMADAQHTFQLMRKYFAGGAASYFYWNMILQPGGKSTWGWAQNALITIDPDQKTVDYHPEFYLMKHASYFVKPGAKLAKTTGAYAEHLAFVNKNGDVVVLLGNKAAEEKTISIGIDDKSTLSVKIPSHSLSTVVIPAK
jgi:glucosylceramidase